MNPLETYLKELSEIRASGAGVKETSYYGHLFNLLNDILKPIKSRTKAEGIQGFLEKRYTKTDIFETSDWKYFNQAATFYWATLYGKTGEDEGLPIWGN